MTDDRGTMRGVSHTHPDHDPRDWHWFGRGPAVAADGGRRNAEDEEMRDVAHIPEDGGEDANRVWDGTRVHEHDDASGDEG